MARTTAAAAIVGLLACAHGKAFTADALTIPHPDDNSKTVEAFLKKPQGHGPWPTVILLHGYQSWPPSGGRDFVDWGVLDKYAQRGYLAVSVSQPGFGHSTGPADFCGPFTQDAVFGIMHSLKSRGLSSKVLIEGVSRGALVAGLMAASDKASAAGVSGVVLISGLYDLPSFVSHASTPEAQSVAKSLASETAGEPDALAARSLLFRVQKMRVPALILNGAKDDRTDPTQATRLAHELNARGIRARSVIYPNFGHQIPIDVRDKEVDPFISSVLGTERRGSFR